MAAVLEKKDCYHSAMVGLSPVEMMFTGPVTPSKFKGREPFIPFKLRGDAEEHRYTIENGDIEEKLADAPRNTWLTVQFAGSRDAATLEWDDEGDVPPSRSTPPAKPSPSNSQHADADETTIAADYWNALNAAQAVVARFERDYKRPPTEGELSVAATLFIQKQRDHTRPLAKGLT